MRSISLCCILFLLCVGSPAHSASFQALDFLPRDVSGDGQVVVGERQRWSRSQGTLGGVGIDGPLLSVNFDGTRIVGSAEIFFPVFPGYGIETFVWDEADGLRASGLSDPGVSIRLGGMSPNGRYVSGFLYEGGGFYPFLWDYEAGGAADLTLGLGGEFTRPFDVSNDAVVVGSCCGDHNDDHAFRWGPVGRGAFLEAPIGPDARSRALAISHDSGTIVGWVLDPAGSGMRATRWNAAGELTMLGELPGYSLGTQATAVSADGGVIVGFGYAGATDPPSSDGAFLWTQDGGVQSLSILLRSLGLDEVEGWELEEARAISADGNTIVGIGTNAAGQTQGFIAVIPEPGTALLLGLGLIGLGTGRQPGRGTRRESFR